MNHKQKLGYTLLGAGIMALGIIIGQIVTPDIKAQNNGVFDKIVCREIQVVDKDGKKAIVLQSNEGDNQLIVYKPQNKRANVVGIKMEANNLTNQIKIADTTHKRTAIWLYSTVMLGTVNKVAVSPPARGTGGVRLSATDRDSRLSIDGGNVFLQSSDKQNLILLQDLKDPLQEAFEIVSHHEGNFSSRWLRERGRRSNW